jgi:hypothetical protein
MALFGVAVTAWWLGRTDWITDLGTLAALLGAATMFGLRSVRVAMEHARSAEITITADEIRRRDETGECVLHRDDIASFAEPPRGRGLIVRAKPPKRGVIIPADLAGYADCRSELEAMGLRREPFSVRGRWALSGAGVAFLSVLLLMLARSHSVRLASGLMLGVALIASAVLWPNRATREERRRQKAEVEK